MHRLIGTLALASAFVSSYAQKALEAESYILPPKEIAEYFEQPRHQNYTLSNLNSSKTWFARLQGKGYTHLSDIANPYENLGGLMLDTRANRARTMSYRGSTSIVLTNATTFQTQEIPAPNGAWIGNISWSPDGKQLMYLVHDPEQTTIYLFDTASGRKRQLVRTPLLATRVTPQWSGDSKRVVAVIVPSNRGPEPKAGPVPTQPKVQVADKAKNKLRTFRSLLQNDLDKQRLEYFLKGQLVVIDAANGKAKEIGQPSMISGIDPSPKADYVRVTTVQKPFSYIVPVSSFGSKEELWNENGKSLYTILDRKLRSGEDLGDEATRELMPRRSLTWHPSGNGLTFIQNEPKKDGKVAGLEEDEQGRTPPAAADAAAPKRREMLVHWMAPFRKEDEKTLLTTDNGFAGLTFSPDGYTVFLTETADGTSTVYQTPLSDPSKRSKLWSWKTADIGKAPGSPVSTTNSMGVSVLDASSGKVYLRGSEGGVDAEKSPPRPFLDAYDISTGKTSRLWQCEEKSYETIDAILDPVKKNLVINRQTATEQPNSYLVENGVRTRALTSNKDYAPDLTAAKRMRLQVTRADGFKFWVKVTLPSWHVPGDKLPAFFWFYPSEYENQADYDRKERGSNPNLFPVHGASPKTLLLRRGWAFVEPDCPIVGPKGRMNDFYVNDLRNSLSAIIDDLDRRGMCDRTRLALGGHSYGGFSTANAMVHTPFFKAGIAGAGNYNRTLTPLSFQTESRSIFEAKDTYLSMSAMLYAENMTGAMLMYCGMDDQNVGTDPINSVRMYNVLESIGKPTALYMYPYEDHGQIAKETLLDQWARWIAWLDKYVLGVEEKP